jgi:hypothetical protein
MAAEFPFPSVSGSNPQPLYFEMLPEEFVVNRTIYDDGGGDYALQTGAVGLRQWIVRYDGLTSAQAAILDNWAATVFYSEDQGSAYGFNFRHHIGGEVWTSTNGTLYGNCHLAPGGYKKSHVKVEIQAREFLIEQRP